MNNKTATLLTSHVWDSKRKAGFHWIALDLVRRGWSVNFVCTLTTIDLLKKDYRFKYTNKKEYNKKIEKNKLLHQFISYRILRPLKTGNKFIDFLLRNIFSFYLKPPSDVLKLVSESQLVIHESTYELLYFTDFKKNNPRVRYIYRVSDDITTRNTHPILIDYEKDECEKFDLVSVPTDDIYNRFKSLKNSQLNFHGAPLDLFDEVHLSPYKINTINFVYVGNNFLDHNFVTTAAKIYPNINFHIIGPDEVKSNLNNIFNYGEMMFEDTIPFVKFANAGLNPMLKGTFSDSNKMHQYTYCKLPIVISSLNKTNRENCFFYTIGDSSSIRCAIDSALKFNPSEVKLPKPRKWSDLVEDLLKFN
jgi:2-beta-glucuronyltransferase